MDMLTLAKQMQETVLEPLVSIAMCVYNGEAYLEAQLSTLLNQSYQNLEIIIADDGSTDKSVDIIRKYTADPRIKLIINNQNLGYVRNFEKVIKLCKGEYIALADQDDIWNVNKIEILLQAADNALLVYHDSELINSDGRSLGKISDLLNMYSGSSPLPFLFYNCVSGHSCMFKRTLADRLTTFDPQFYHDWWLAYTAACEGSIKYVDQILVKYRQHLNANTDILNSRKKFKKAGSPKYSDINLAWLQNCMRIEGAHQDLIRQLIYLEQNKTFVNSLKLMNLLFANYRELFFLKKKGTLSKLNYIRKMAFYRKPAYATR